MFEAARGGVKVLVSHLANSAKSACQAMGSAIDEAGYQLRGIAREASRQPKRFATSIGLIISLSISLLAASCTKQGIETQVVAPITTTAEVPSPSAEVQLVKTAEPLATEVIVAENPLPNPAEQKGDVAPGSVKATAEAEMATAVPPTVTPTEIPTETPPPQPTATPTAETPQGGEIVDGFRVYEATSGKTTLHAMIQADYVKPADAGHKPYFDTLSSVDGVQGLVDLIEAFNELAKADGYWTGGDGQIDITFRLVQSVLLDEAAALEKSDLGELDFSHSDMFRVYEKIDENGRKITIIFDRDLDKPELQDRGLNLSLFVYTRGRGGYGYGLMISYEKLQNEGNQEKIDRCVAAVHAINDYLEVIQQ